MPVVNASTYRAPFLFRNPHAQTIFPSLLRRPTPPTYRRERIPTPDGDILAVDWSRVGSPNLAVISHGLGGSSRRTYVKGMVQALNQDGWDAAAWNFRGSGGEPSRRPRLTHNGSTGDLGCVVERAAAVGRYRRISLVGFSMGGNLTLNYLGRGEAHPRVDRAVAISTPCVLADASRRLDGWTNRIYLRRFLRLLGELMEEAAERHPEWIDMRGYGKVRSFGEFDDRFTAPLHGFADARDYWTRSSSRPLLGRIRIPTLMLTARDDPFLPESCYPYAEAEASEHLWLETPPRGGHVGFVARRPDGRYWSELRTLAFLRGSGPG